MNINLLTTVLTTFISALATGQRSVQAAGGSLLRALAVIEIVLAGLWMAMDGASVAGPFKKLLQLSFWIWFATTFPTLAKAFSDSLVQMGLAAGGQTGNFGLLLDPSRIAGMALDATQPLIQSMADAGLTHIKDAIILGLCYLIIMGCFFLIACQICLAVVEYYLVVTLATCLIPFGISQHTKFLAEKAIGAVVAVSVKLMVMSFVMGLIQPVLGQVKFSGAGEVTLNEVMSMILVCGLLAIIVWRAPGFASDLLAGSPSLSVAAVGQHVASAVSSGVNATSGAVAAGLGATRTAASMVRSGTTSVAGAAGMIRSAVAGGARGKGPVDSASGAGSLAAAGHVNAAATGGGVGAGKPPSASA